MAGSWPNDVGHDGSALRAAASERENMSDLSIDESLGRLEKWIESHDYKGYEPFDGLTSFLLPLTGNSRTARQVLQQAVRRSPLNLRPFLGVKPLDSTKGRGYVAWGYLKRYRLTNDAIFREKALDCLDWLDKNRSPLYPGHSWGNHFTYSSRSGHIPKDVSTVVWTGLIGQVFLEAYALFGRPRDLEIIGSIADWVMALPREDTDRGSCLSYIMPSQRSIHNSNMIGAAFLAGAAVASGTLRVSTGRPRAMEYSCARQRTDGAWFYGDEEKHHWIDVFHTGYNLDALRRYQDASGDRASRSNWKEDTRISSGTSSSPDGRVRYYHNKAKPIDIQCASQAIDTLCLFAGDDPGAGTMAMKTAQWYIQRMQDRDGHFYFRHYTRGVNNKAAMIHWGQATMHKALAHLALVADRKSG